MRVILLDRIFENKEDMFSLLTEDSENYAFSDQQMQRIEENLLLRSVDKLPEISQKTIKEIEEPDPFVRTLLEEPDTYELWNSVDRQKKENQPDTILNLEELQHYIGIHTFFQYQQEQEEKEEAAQPPKEVGFISVSVGKGMTEIFKELGVDYLIEGGQTMNPSTEDMLNAIAKVNAKTIYIFPNNKNIVLAANQARDLTEDKEIVVVPTKTIPQGITAMISYVPEKNSAENTEAMLQAIEHVKTGQITYAVRDTRIDDKEIHEGDMMGIGDHGILAVGKDRMEVAKETVAQMVDDESEVISIYYGADTEEAEAEELATALEEAYPDCDVELNAGGQPIYYYVISVE